MGLSEKLQESRFNLNSKFNDTTRKIMFRVSPQWPLFVVYLKLKFN